MNTVRATRAASLDELIEQTLPRLDSMLSHGTTTAEVKTGYGLSTESEIKMLDAIRLLDEEHPMDLVPTFLGAHAVPAEYEGRTDAFVDLIVDEMLPAIADLRPASSINSHVDRASPIFTGATIRRPASGSPLACGV